MMTHGVYPQMSLAEANKAHADALVKLNKGADPGAEIVQAKRADREADTIADLVAEYLEKWAKPRKRSWREDQRILHKDILPRWGRRKASLITRRDIITLLDTIIDRGSPIAANRTLAVIRRMFNFALSRDVIDSSPVVSIKPPAPENRRDRVLSDAEIKTFWIKLDTTSISDLLRCALKLQLLTAQRPGEIITAEWSEINNDWWTIPAGRAKNGLSHRVPLSIQAIALMEDIHTISGDKRWLFPSPKGDKPINPDSLPKSIARNRGVFGIDRFVPHDLRRTAASHMTGMGISRLVVSKILNHAEYTVTAVYDRHSYDCDKRSALDAWGRKLDSIIHGHTDNILNIR
jgi:integrase